MAEDCEIAIVGAGCRFPGADNLNEFWRVLINGENHVTEIPRERWNNDAFYSEDKHANGKIYVKKAGLIKGHDEFDPRPFGISDAEAERIGPQQRYVLECVHMALEDGGITRASVSGTRTGVYIGCMNDDYKGMFTGYHGYDNSYSATGSSSTIISARVSYVFNLQGPCMTLDTACSSALVAVHLGAQAIITGDCEMAVCGGVSSILTPETFIPLCRAGMMSAVGQCQSFCDSADGYARGEGCGIIILKKLSQALEEGNKIWAVIKTGTNQDGRTAQPITSPSAEQQFRLLDTLYSTTKTDPSSVQYIEAHGTGTKAGDPAEINTLGRFFSQYRSEESGQTENLLVGSVKTNIGHTESAAGVAGLLKVMLMMKHGKIVPSLHLKTDKSNLNPNIKLSHYNMDIPVEMRDWKRNQNGNRITCVNSFGFGGSNGHAILIQKQSFTSENDYEPIHQEYKRFVAISSATFDGLKLALETFKRDISSSEEKIERISYTSTCRRDHFPYRVCLVADSIKDLVSQTRKVVNDKKPTMNTNIVFVFCGVGTAWPGMCSELIRSNSAFRQGVKNVDRYLQPLAGISMTELFFDSTSEYIDPFLNHVSIFTTQVGLTEMWRSVGVQPNVIVGQSVGEVAAAYASGALDLKSAVYVIFNRSKILASQIGGSMVVVKNIDVQVLEKMCDQYERKVTIAVYSSPVACTLSGESNVMTKIKDDVLEYAKQNKIDVFITDLRVQCAYHSHLVDPCINGIKQALDNLQSMHNAVQIISTVTGKLTDPEEFQSAEYWARNVREPVHLSGAILTARKKNSKNIFLEIGPKPILHAHINDICTDDTSICLPSMKYKSELASRTSTYVELFETGVNIKWVWDTRTMLSSIPTYSFDRRRILFVPDEVKRTLYGHSAAPQNEHMFIQNSVKEGEEFKLVIGKQTTPYVYDHFMAGALLVPGATYVEAGFAIACRKLKLPIAYIAVSLELVNTFTPSDEKECEIECNVRLQSSAIDFEFSKGSRILSVGKAFRCEPFHKGCININYLKENLATELTKADVYESLKGFGFTYGPSLSLIESAWLSNRECLVEIKVPSSVLMEFEKTRIHPAAIDAVFQVFGIFTSRDVPVFPKGVHTMRVKGQPQQRMFCYAVKVRSVGKQTYYNALLLDVDGGVICELLDFYTQELSSEPDKTSMYYKLDWQALELDHRNTDLIPPKAVLLFGTDIAIQFMDSVFGSYTLDVVRLDIEGQSESFIRAKVVEQTKKKVYTAILFAPFTNLELTKDSSDVVYKIIKRTVCCLKDFLIALSETTVQAPLFVMTHNTQNQTLHDGCVFVNGSELWGMVRCAVHETVYPDIRLLDVDMANVDSETLLNIINNCLSSEQELRVSGKSIWKSRLTNEVAVKITKRSISHLEKGDMVYLKTTKPDEYWMPFMELAEHKHQKRWNACATVRLDLVYACLHDKAIYPVTYDDKDQKYLIWPDLSTEGFRTIALEGQGYVHQESDMKIELAFRRLKYFCYPVSIATYVDVPSEYIFDPSDIPGYIPGLLTSAVIFYNISSKTPERVTVAVLAERGASYSRQLLEMFLATSSKRSVHHFSKSDVDQQSVANNVCLEHIQCLTVLTKVNQTNLQYLVSCLPNLKYISSLSVYISAGTKHWLAKLYPEISFTELRCEDMFQADRLKESIPTVHYVLKNNIDKYFASGDGIVADNNPISLPCMTVSMTENKHELQLYAQATQLFRKNSCYIVVGGLTGLGWKIMEFIAERGGGFLRSISRRKPSASQQYDMTRLSNTTSCSIKAFQCDVTDIKSLKNTIVNIQRELNGIKIKGIFNGAGVLADCLLVNMTDEYLDKVLKPKILGSLNLHLTTRHLDLDFFVMHSSVASVIGNTGQSNYGAANSFLDALAHYRRSKHLSGQSINWGPLSVGMIQENQEIEIRLQHIGMTALEVVEIYTLLQGTLQSDYCQVTLGSFNWSKIRKHLGSSKLNTITKPEKKDFIEENENETFDVTSFHQIQGYRKVEILYDLIKQVLCNVFTITDTALLTQDFIISDFGVDSFSAMSFVNKMYDTTGCRLPIQMLLSDETTLHTIVDFIMENLQSMEGNTISSNDIHPILHPESKLSFCERAVLLDYHKASNKGNFLRVFDLSVELTEWDLNTWERLLRHVVYMNQELCRKFIIRDAEVEVIDITEENLDLKVEEISIDDIGNHDPRKHHSFDLQEHLPIKFQIAFEKQYTVLRMMLHAVAQDLPTLTFIYEDLQNVANILLRGDQLPSRHKKPHIPRVLHNAVRKRYHAMKEYWAKQMKMVKETPSINKRDVKGTLDAEKFKVMKGHFPQKVINRIFDFLQEKKLTIFQFFISVYQLFLNGATGCETIPVVSATDMRIHDEELKTAFGRCVNYIPYISSFREFISFHSFIESNSKIITATLEHSAYPYHMILEELQNEEIRKVIGRHKMVMDNFSELGPIMQKRNSKIKMKNMWVTSNEEETCFYVGYDLLAKTINFTFGYNTAVVDETTGNSMVANLVSLITKCLESNESHETLIVKMKPNMTKRICDEDNKSKLHDTDLRRNSQKQTHICTADSTFEKEETSIYTEVKSIDSSHTVSRDKKNISSRKHTNTVDIIKTGVVRKRTRQGWDHRVQLALKRRTTPEQTMQHDALSFEWERSVNKAIRRIPFSSIREVRCWQINSDFSAFVIHTNKRKYVMKTDTPEETDDWMTAIQSAIDTVKTTKL